MKKLYRGSYILVIDAQIWPPRAILVSDWLLFKEIFSSETAWQNGAKFGRKHL
jgi:purine-cytosine permease-like protein